MNKRYLTAMVASSLLAIGAIYAEDAPCPQDCPPVCKPCPPPCEPCPPPPPPVCEPCPAPCYQPCYDPCWDPCCDPCDQDCCWTGFRFGADFLYWRPCLDDLEYANLFDRTINSNGSGSGLHNGTYKRICPEWEPGFRVFVEIDDVWCDWGLLGTYTWIKSCNTASTQSTGSEFLESFYTHTWDTIGPQTPTFLEPFDVGLTFVTMKQEFTYQDFNALFVTDYCLKSCHHLQPFFGVTGLFFNQKNVSTWQQDVEGVIVSETVNTGSTTFDSCFSGVGFRFGSQYSFSICDGLRLFGNGSAAVTVGNHDSTTTFYKLKIADEVETEYDYNFKDDECVFVAGYHIQIGFEYDLCLCGCDFGLRLGYEFLNWHNVPNIRKFQSEGPPEVSYSSSPTVSTLGFHGLFAGLEFSF